jgi:hypothetical protein
MKLVSKEPVGPTYRKRYDKARPPFQRLLERDDASPLCKAAVLALKDSTGLLEQQALLNRAIEHLEQCADTFKPSWRAHGLQGKIFTLGNSFLSVRFLHEESRVPLFSHFKKNRPSDRGSQYCSKSFRDALSACCPTVRQSMSRKGNCWDNGCAESFFQNSETGIGNLGRQTFCGGGRTIGVHVS